MHKNKGTVIIQFDYSDDNKSLSYMEAKEEILKGTPIIYTHCLDFFSFSTLFNKDYEVKILKKNGEFIILSELLENDNPYIKRDIRHAHNVHNMLLANAFSFREPTT